MKQPRQIDKKLLEDQMAQISQALFAAKSVKEVQFLQTKLAYFKKQMKENRKK